MRVLKLFLLVVYATMILTWPAGSALGYELKKGESLAYSAKFLYIFPLGNVVLRAGDATGYNGRDIFLITCEAKTAKWISFLFKAEAVLNSYVSVKNLYPYRFEQVLKVAGRTDDIRRATYDRANNIMEAEGKGKKKVPADVRDPISAIYYLRTQELKEGAEIKQMVNSNQSTYVFDAKVIGKKKVGRVNCWVLDAKIRRENKSMYHSMDVEIYISDDERQEPVLIQAKTNVGPVTLRLIKD